LPSKSRIPYFFNNANKKTLHTTVQKSYHYLKYTASKNMKERFWTKKIKPHRPHLITYDEKKLLDFERKREMKYN